MFDDVTTVILVLLFSTFAVHFFCLIRANYTSFKLKRKLESNQYSNAPSELLSLGMIFRMKPLVERVDESTLAPYYYWHGKLWEAVNSNRISLSSIELSVQWFHLKHFLFFNFYRTNFPFTLVFSFLCFAPFGFIPVLLYGLYFFWVYKSASKYEITLKQFISGKLEQSSQKDGSDINPHALSTSKADEISKLLLLKQNGIISDSEFEIEKKKILVA